jgi:3-phosphoshikimate 1-carboxyvinyltransferase
MQDYLVQPCARVRAVIEVSSSKSYTNRAYIIGALADGETLLKNVLVSDDTLRMHSALAALSVPLRRSGVSTVLISGGAQNLRQAKEEIYLGNSGTSLRLLTAFCALVPGDTVLTGDARLAERPMEDLLSAAQQAGIDAISEKNNGHAPIVVKGTGSISGGKITIEGGISSQYLTSLMIIAPYAKQDLEISVIGALTSKPYIDITIDIMSAFGVEVINENYRRFFVPSGKAYVAREYAIEADYSSAGYFFAAAALTGGVVKVKGLKHDSKQGDAKMLSLLEQMGCAILKGDDFVEVQGTKALKPVNADMNACPDMAMTIAVLAAFAEGKTTIKNVYNIRLKECDRLAATIAGLKALGVFVEELDDGMIIHGSADLRTLHGGAIDTYNDHRIAMSFALAGLRIPGVIICNKACVSKTFPNFWECFERLYG